MIAATIILIVLALIATILFAKSLDCKHEFINPVRLTVGEWYEHEQTIPALPGEKILLYRRDVVFSCRCSKCGVLERQKGYDTKPHESDKMVADLKAHGVDEDWKPAPAPWAQTE